MTEEGEESLLQLYYTTEQVFVVVGRLWFVLCKKTD